MKNLLAEFLFFAALTAACRLQAQIAPSIEWQKSLGGSSFETAKDIQQTTDGGFIVAGYSQSSNGDVTEYHGYYDYWIVKLDAIGNLVWQKSYGGFGDDEATSVQQTTDGGFIVAGFSYSNNGNVSGHHGLISCSDYWIVKLDTAGNLVWQKSLGGTVNDRPYSIQQTTDGGFIVAGWTNSVDEDVTGNHGFEDCWVVKLDALGDLIWQKTLGGSNGDEAHSVQQTADGGFIVAGWSSSGNGDLTANHGAGDYWIVKLDTDGTLVWQKSYGGSDHDEAHSIQQITDGGFIVAGWSSSNDGDVSGNHGLEDYWILKLNSEGNLIWQKSLGGSDFDEAYSVQQTTGGDFTVAGLSISKNGDVTGNHGADDYWIVKLDVDGNLVWQKSLGGSDNDGAFSGRQTSNDGFISAGHSYSNDGDVSGNHSHDDYWVVKLSNDTTTGIASVANDFISLYPNPAETQLFISLETRPNELTIRVCDLQGKIRQTALSGQTDKIMLNIENLSAGFYTLQITNNQTGEIGIAKFVKQ